MNSIIKKGVAILFARIVYHCSMKNDGGTAGRVNALQQHSPCRYWV